MQELIERLENATGPDREIDLAIHVAIEPDGDIARVTSQYRRGLDGNEGMAWDIGRQGWGGAVLFEKWTDDGRCPYNGGYPLPRYTESIDDAVRLVSDGWAWFVEWIGAPFSEGRARLWIPSQRTQGLKTERAEADAKTPAIAICIAALKART